jgi:hypothetical protein
MASCPIDSQSEKETVGDLPTASTDQPASSISYPEINEHIMIIVEFCDRVSIAK